MTTSQQEHNERYPQHAKFKQEREKLENLRDFLEHICEKARGAKLLPRISGLSEQDQRDLGNLIFDMSDRDKEFIIFEFAGLDQTEYYRERERMAEELYNQAADRERSKKS